MDEIKLRSIIFAVVTLSALICHLGCNSEVVEEVEEEAKEVEEVEVEVLEEVGDEAEDRRLLLYRKMTF